MKVTQSCPTLCDPMDCSLPGSSVHGILQARILEWVVIPFSRDLSYRGIEPRSPALQADSLPSEPLGMPGRLKKCCWVQKSHLMAVGWGKLHGCFSFFAVVGAGPEQLPSCPHQRQQAVICFLGCIKQVGRQ